MPSLSQLEASAIIQPNSIEINEALADAYAKHGRWVEAVKTYQILKSLYPETAALFIDRIRLGAMALAISSFLFLIAELISPSLPLPANPMEHMQTISLPAFLGAQILFLLAFALYSCSAISIYKLLSYTRDHRPAFWAMVLSVLGVGLSMPLLGINAFVLPLIGRLYLNGEAGVLSLYIALRQELWPFILQFGVYLLIMGMMIFSWVVWRNRNLSQIAILIYLAGWIGFALSNNQLPKSGLILIGILIAIGGVGFSRSLWIQASTQFDPTMDRSLNS